MQVLITGKGIELTQAIKDYATKKMEGLEKFYKNIIRAEMVVGMDNHHHQKGKIFLAECKLAVPSKDLFASKQEKTLYKAIDKIRDYLESEAKKLKAKQYRAENKKTIRAKRLSKEYQEEL